MKTMTRFDRAVEYAADEIAKWKYSRYIEKIYLYGSCARNEQGADSDIDLYICLNRPVPPKDVRELKIRCNPEDWRLPDVDIKIGNTCGVGNDGDLFHMNVAREGILLWEKK